MGTFILIAFAIVFTVMWASVSLLLSHMGGWSKLASHYADTENLRGATYYLRSGCIGAVRYKSCLVLRVCESGLRLSVLFPFRFGHPPLFIPWDQFHSVTERRALFAAFLDASVGRPVVTNVMLPLWIRDHLPPELRPT